jgi:hypothetical protein
LGYRGFRRVGILGGSVFRPFLRGSVFRPVFGYRGFGGVNPGFTHFRGLRGYFGVWFI